MTANLSEQKADEGAGRVPTAPGSIASGDQAAAHLGPSGNDPIALGLNRYLRRWEAEMQGYTPEHIREDGGVRSMVTKEGYLVVYGASPYAGAVHRANKLLGWHMPANLRWLADNPTAAHLPCGSLHGAFLYAVADSIERLAAQAMSAGTAETEVEKGPPQ